LRILACAQASCPAVIPAHHKEDSQFLPLFSQKAIMVESADTENFDPQGF